MSRGGRPPRLTPEVVEAIRARRKAGATYELLQREFGLSKGAVGDAVNGHGVAAPKPGRRRDKAATVPEEPAADAPAVLDAARALVARAESGETDALDALRRALDPEAGDALATVRRCLATADRLLRRVPSEDVASFATLARLSTAAAIAIGKLTPPPTQSAEDSPDMVAAAQRARDKLREYVQRIAAGEPLGADPSPAQLFAAALVARST